MKTSLKTILCVINPTKPLAIQAAEKLKQEISQKPVKINITTQYPPPEKLIAESDCILALGGDGTLLGMVPYAYRYNKILGGINCGQLGFLSMFPAEYFNQSLSKFLEGNYCVEERYLLHTNSTNEPSLIALNDIVVKSADQRMITLSLAVENGEKIADFRCDGILFSTPTGSTAYNLSANGPIITPTAKVWIANPICSHSFFNRALILDEKTVLWINGSSAVEIFADGVHTALKLPLRLSFGKTIRLLLPSCYNYFETIHKKFFNAPIE